MELLIKQRVFSWSDTYDVYDQNEEAKYYVEAEILAFGHQIHVYDKRSGREVGSIHQKLLAWLPTFEIVIGGQTVGSVRREFSLFRPRYHVDFCGWDVEGDYLNWQYSVYRDTQPVLQITKQWLTWGDTYVLSYTDPADELSGLLLAIAIDAANCRDD